MKKDRETAAQKYDTQHRADGFSVGGGIKMLKHSAPFISPEGHERSSGQHESPERLGKSAALGRSSDGGAEGTRLRTGRH